jgi:F420-0:gamma-glutamyl ligase
VVEGVVDGVVDVDVVVLGGTVVTVVEGATVDVGKVVPAESREGLSLPSSRARTNTAASSTTTVNPSHTVHSRRMRGAPLAGQRSQG